MPYVLLTVAAAILAGVVVVAMGRGGELAMFPRDRPVPAPGPELAPRPRWGAAPERDASDGDGPQADGGAE